MAEIPEHLSPAQAGRPSPGPITELLHDWAEGDLEALDSVLEQLGRDLRRLAAALFDGERPSHTLQPTALVNELYLRLTDRREMSWQGRAHFFSFAARTMRRVLVDHARRRQAAKRGGDALRVPLEEVDETAPGLSVEVLDLHRALHRLERFAPRECQVVELRSFAGLSLAETAELLRSSVATVSRDWAAAKAWLYAELAGPDGAIGDGR